MRVGAMLLLPVLAACAADPAGPTVPAGVEPVHVRGWLWLKTAIHVHSVHSHDACDGDPKPGGAPNEPCLEDFREGICGSGMDVVFATEHDSSMADVPFSELLLPFVRQGDELLGPSDSPTALRIACDEQGRDAFLVPGAENDLMPIGMKRHPDAPEGQLHAVYNASDEPSVRAWQEAGGTVIVSHAEGWTTEDIAALPIDGIEIYNLHAAIDPRRGGLTALGNLSAFLRPSDDPPDPDLAFLALFADLEADLVHWSRLGQTRRIPGVMAHDIHRNVLPAPLSDGERFDSYRRVLSWFSNHVLVPRLDPVAAQEAVAEGRLALVLDVAGDPTGFDAVVVKGDQVVGEMGGEVPFSTGLAARVTRPSLASDIPDGVEAPEIGVRLLEMLADGATTVLAEGTGDLRVELPGPGVYRAEVLITPRHLRPRLPGAESLADRQQVWIRGNPFYVRGE